MLLCNVNLHPGGGVKKPNWRLVWMTGEPRVHVVANLPYYISTPIIERLMAAGRRIFDMTLMLQSEVVERISSPPGSRQYGYLSVLVQYHCHATKLFEVPPGAFRPRPKVQSAILRLVVRQRPAVEIADRVRPGVVGSTKGHWLKHVRGGANINATVEERDTDMGGGAIYHDNRVDVERTSVSVDDLDQPRDQTRFTPGRRARTSSTMRTAVRR